MIYTVFFFFFFSIFRSYLFTLQKSSCLLNTKIFFHFASLEAWRLGVCLMGLFIERSVFVFES